MANMVFTATSRAALHDAERYWLAKFILRVTTIVVALIAIIMISWASGQETDAYGFLYLIVREFIPVRFFKSLAFAKFAGITT